MSFFGNLGDAFSEVGDFFSDGWECMKNGNVLAGIGNWATGTADAVGNTVTLGGAHWAGKKLENAGIGASKDAPIIANTAIESISPAIVEETSVKRDLSKYDLYDELAEEGLTMADGAYVMQVEDLCKDSDADELIMLAEAKYLGENATSENITDPKFKAEMFAHLQDIKTVSNVMFGAEDTLRPENQDAYIDAAAEMFPGGKEKFYAVKNEISDIIDSVEAYEDRMSKPIEHIPNSPGSVDEARKAAQEKAAYNAAPDWMKKTVLAKDFMETDHVYLNYRIAYCKDELAANANTYQAGKAEAQLNAISNAFGPFASGLKPFMNNIKQTMANVADNVSTKVETVTNADKAKNDAWLNSVAGSAGKSVANENQFE